MKLPFARIIFGLFLITSGVRAAQMTNQDVVKMSESKLDEGIIITVIENADAKFDVSTPALIELSTAKVSSKVVQAMIKKSAPAQGASTAEAATDAMKPSDIYMNDGGEQKIMHYLTPTTRSAVRALGYGGVALYSVLRGPAAQLRSQVTSPSFLMPIPEQAQPESYFTLASFAVRSNGTREVMVGGSGFMSYSTGIHSDRIIAVDSVKAADQSHAPKGFVLYQIKPKAALKKGEYAVVLYTAELHSLVGNWFAAGNSYFDFGVD